MEDTNKELERIEKELLAMETEPPVEEADPLADAELYALLKEDVEPAFDDPSDFRDTDEPVRNFSNDYGESPEPEVDGKKKKDDKIIIGLMIGASALCLGILGILVYWMEAFIR